VGKKIGALEPCGSGAPFNCAVKFLRLFGSIWVKNNPGARAWQEGYSVIFCEKLCMHVENLGYYKASMQRRVYPAVQRHKAAAIEKGRQSMTLSARNRLEGKITELDFGGVMAHVVVRVGENVIESVITKRSADEMSLKVGDTVTAVIKSTEVMLEKK
jgi:molybdopterin-binding protein